MAGEVLPIVASAAYWYEIHDTADLLDLPAETVQFIKDHVNVRFVNDRRAFVRGSDLARIILTLPTEPPEASAQPMRRGVK